MLLESASLPAPPKQFLDLRPLGLIPSPHVWLPEITKSESRALQDRLMLELPHKFNSSLKLPGLQ